MKGYDSYKTSNIEGIKQVPSHWKSIKLKFIGSLFSGLTGKSGNDFYNEDNPLSRPYINFKNIANNVKINPKQFDLVEIKPNEEQNQVKKGDLFFLMSSENFDDIAKTAVLVDDLKETYLNSFCRGFRIHDKNFVPEFLNYLLLSGHYREILSNEAKGFTRINIQVGKINNFPIYAPFNKEEQTQIASFLDYKTNLLDATIEKKKRLIELLKEKRQAVINEAVTKGIKPNTPMKDSGVEWLGKIPGNWSLVPLRYLYNKIGSGVTPKGGGDVYVDEGVTFIRSQNVHFDGLRLDDVVKIDSDTHQKMNNSNVEFNDVLLNITGASIGRCCVVNIDEEMNVNQHVCIIRVNEKINPDYLNVVLQSNVGQIQIKLLTTGGNREGLTHEAVKNLIIPLPNIETQIELLKNVSQKLNTYDLINNKILENIKKLQAYRQSLISEAVTGKIDVRDWQSTTKNT